MYMFSSKELAPTEDQGVIFGIIEAPANATIDQTVKYANKVEEAFLHIPETAFTFQLTFPTSGFGGGVLKPWNDRKRTAFEILPEAQQKLSTISAISIFPVMPPPLPGGGSFPVEIVLASTAEPDRILEFAKKLQQKAMSDPALQFWFPPIIDTKIDQPQTEIQIDREKVAALGLDLQQVGADVSAAVGGNFVNRFNIEGRSYKVIPQVERAARLTPEQLQQIYVTGPDGKLMALSNIATLKETTQPRTLNRFQQLNAVKISGATGLPLDQALKALEDEAAKILPEGYKIDYTGESRQLRTEGNKFLPAFSLALLLIFLVLAAQFNSFRDPFVILAGSVPLALFGALLMTFLKSPGNNVPGWTTTLNIYSQVGLVTLIGLISKNGILVVEFANQLQRAGHGKLEAIRQAARIRLRPVLMTTVATVAGHFPLVLVTGAGAIARNSIGLVLVAGMSIGTLFTLFVVPSLYMLIAKDHTAERKLEAEKFEGVEEAEALSA